MKTAVAGIVIYKSQILIGKKIVKSDHFLSGGWHIPGGHVLKNENNIDALIREFKEETSLDIKVINKIVAKAIPENNVIVHWYLCKARSNKFSPGDDLSEIQFIDKKKIITKCDKRAVSLWPKKVIAYFKK